MKHFLHFKTSLALLALALFMLIPGLGRGQLMVDDFNYTIGTDLTANGWNITGTNATPTIAVTAASITYPGYLSSGIGNEVTLATSGQDVNHTFTSQTSGTVYASCLINVTSATTTGDYFFHLGAFAIGSTYHGRVFIKKDVSNNLSFGISKVGAIGTAVFTPYSYALNTTYLLVLRYTIVPGASNDVAAIYINPTLNAVEPITGWTTSTDVAADLANIGTVALRQGTAANAPALKLDGIRIAQTWADIVGPAATPVITTDQSTLSNFGYVLGNGPSPEKSFHVSGVNLTGNISLTPPADYEISTGTGGSFVPTNPITLVQSGGNVASTTIYTRLKSGLSIGMYNNENIAAASSGAASQNVNCNGFVGGGEPSNYATNFTIGTPTTYTIPLTWTDATGTILPSGYLIKASAVSYAAIIPPVDYIAEADGPLVKNVAYGVGSVTFTGLIPNTPYYFEIWPYTTTGTYNDYKLNGAVPQQTGTTTLLNFRSLGTGAWNAATTWEISNDNNTWTAATSEVPIYPNSNVTIRNGHSVNVPISYNSGTCRNLTVENGATLYANSSANSCFVYVYGDIQNDGTIGGATDVIGFDIEGSSCLLSGIGTFTAARISKYTTANTTTTFTINQNLTLTYTSASSPGALYNNVSGSTTFNIILAAGRQLSVQNARITLTGCTLAIKNNASLLDNGTITGSTAANTTVDRFINAWTDNNHGWHLLSSPVAVQAIQPNFVPSPPDNLEDFYAWDEVNGWWFNSKDPCLLYTSPSPRD